MSSQYIVRPSATSQRFNCSGSFILERDAPKEEESEYAAEGTMAHDYCAKVLELYFAGKEEHIYKLIDSIPVGDDNEFIDMSFHVHNYYRLVRAIEAKVGGFDDVWIEQTVAFNEYLGGTADFSATYDNGTKLLVLDLKYGQGVSVVAEDNTQLMSYLLCVKRTRKLDSLAGATMIIYQPRARDGHRPIRDWTVTAEEIDSFEKHFEERVSHCKDVYYGDAPPVYSAGDHCFWCRAKPFCKEFKEDIKRKGVIALEKSDLNLPSPDKLTPAQIRDVMFVKDRILEFYRSLEPYVLSRMEQGEKFDGLKIVTGKSNRIWSKEPEEVAEELTMLGIKNPWQKPKPKLITIGEVEKLIGKNKLGHITRKPPGKPKVVRDDDPRAEVHTDNPLDMLDDVDCEEF